MSKRKIMVPKLDFFVNVCNGSISAEDWLSFSGKVALIWRKGGSNSPDKWIFHPGIYMKDYGYYYDLKNKLTELESL